MLVRHSHLSHASPVQGWHLLCTCVTGGGVIAEQRQVTAALFLEQKILFFWHCLLPLDATLLLRQMVMMQAGKGH